MVKLTRHYGKQLSLVQLRGTKFQSSVIYASSTGVDANDQKLYDLNSKEKISDVTLQLHESI